MKRTVAVAVLVFVAFSTAVAQAEPLTFASGIINIVPQGGVRTRVDLLIQGSGVLFSRTALFDVEAQPLACERVVCTTGTTVSASVIAHPLGFAAGVVNGVTYTDTPSDDPSAPALLLAADLWFVADEFQLPGNASGSFSRTMPFTLTGHLLAYAATGASAANRTLQNILDTSIEAHGLAELRLDVIGQDIIGQRSASSFVNPTAQYVLESTSPAPVPEPSSWVLFAGGLLLTLRHVAWRPSGRVRPQGFSLAPWSSR
jgi:hypothetical protein